MPASQRFDLVIFGASGFTGKRVVNELARIGKHYPDLTWAVAGRSRGKLEGVLHDVSEKSGDDLSNIKIIADADGNDEASIKGMCAQAKVLINCSGPFTKFGEVVVAACVEFNTHYLDVSGETQFIELLEEKYDNPAREAGVFVINSCGLSSIPADVGVQFLEENFGGTLNSVESYLITYFPPRMMSEIFNGIVRYSSWESLITSFAALPLKKIRQQPSCNLEPELKQRCLLHKNLSKWCLPFPAADNFVVNRTQRHLLSLEGKRPVQYKPYLAFPGFFTAIGTIIGCIFLFILCKIPCTKRLLLNYPRLCSFGIVTYGDPKEGAMDESKFQYEMLGMGWDEGTDLGKAPDKKVVARISVTGLDPAYTSTAIIIIFSAITILKERDKMPGAGGVVTGGVAFRKTSIIKRLQENNIKFEIVKSSEKY